MPEWLAWAIVAVLFGGPLALLWRWRHEPSKPQARQDLEDAYREAQTRRPAAATQFEADRWRARGRLW